MTVDFILLAEPHSSAENLLRMVGKESWLRVSLASRTSSDDTSVGKGLQEHLACLEIWLPPTSEELFWMHARHADSGWTVAANASFSTLRCFLTESKSKVVALARRNYIEQSVELFYRQLTGAAPFHAHAEPVTYERAMHAQLLQFLKRLKDQKEFLLDICDGLRPLRVYHEDVLSNRASRLLCDYLELVVIPVGTPVPTVHHPELSSLKFLIHRLDELVGDVAAGWIDTDPDRVAMLD